MCRDSMALTPMPKKAKQVRRNLGRVKLNARVTQAAYNVITEIQRRHRIQTGRALRLWEVVDAAILDYAKRQGIELGR
jgi:hypothetical protein